MHEKKEKEAEYAELQHKCEELQRLKFGMLIDLEALDGATVNKAAEAIRVSRIIRR